MLTDRYEELHAQYLQALTAYHSIYIRYIKGKQTNEDYSKFHRALRKLRDINTQMIKEALAVSKAKKVSNMDKYQEQRTRNQKNDRYNSTD
jgi:hypothetical protein